MSLCLLAGLFITLCIVAGCCYILWWGIQDAPFMKSPFAWVFKMLFAIICVVAIIEVLSGKLEIGQRLLGNC